MHSRVKKTANWYTMGLNVSRQRGTHQRERERERESVWNEPRTPQRNRLYHCQRAPCLSSEQPRGLLFQQRSLELCSPATASTTTTTTNTTTTTTTTTSTTTTTTTAMATATTTATTTGNVRVVILQKVVTVYKDWVSCLLCFHTVGWVSVKNLAPNVHFFDNFVGPALTWSDLWNTGSVKPTKNSNSRLLLLLVILLLLLVAQRYNLIVAKY